ncbi:alpha/beta fold hydrolase [Terribacillus sp. 7520-G]|uniref:alpha/beta fold hydrolase n=1 Tax=Terribacillus sp. 7520-G TaxID=2025389 RepID=UPI000BA708D1|nr:alpha/beta hydrolase [Terribacillus sp. 7520-G]PAD39666.1 alpha/beta hydrolase [Terribacillus sp. 7520-G]
MIIYALLAVVLVIGFLVGFNHAEFKKAEKAFPPQGKFVTVDGHTLHYISAGTGQPVVFLHGGMLSSRDFAAAVQLAAAQGFHAIAFDRPGYGYSSRSTAGKTTPDSQAVLLHHALKKIGVEQPIILVGHSWSGTMTLSYALQFPSLAAGLIIAGGAMYKEGYPAEHGDILSKIVTTPVLGSTLLRTLLKTPLAKRMANTMVKQTFAPESVPAGYTEATYALGFRPRHFRANREDVLAFPGASKKLSGRYKEITVPVVIIVGEQDPFGTIVQAERLKKDIPHSLLKRIPDIGHMIPELHPEVIVESIRSLPDDSLPKMSF